MALPDKKTAAIGVSGFAGLAAMFAVLDGRYATASDVEMLTQTIQMDRVDRLENCIERAENTIRYMSLIPDDERDARDEQELMDAEISKERCIRKLERIENE